MRTDEKNVIFSSCPDYFEKEKSGIKPNTVRQLNDGEYNMLKLWFKSRPHHHIIIKSTESKAHFHRTITDMSHLGYSLGLHLIIISWALPGGRLE